ncbi:MAG: tetratricopeptide repeat protein [Planctomycetaceae bacterium]|nr:tetratricopeptide repeat protein [Planctomycetaceae bacterium]
MSAVPPTSDGSLLRRAAGLVIVLGLLAGLGWLVANPLSENPPVADSPADERLPPAASEQTLPAGIPDADYREAAMTFFGLKGVRPEHADTLMTLGELARAEEQFQLAATAFLAIPSDHPAYGPSSRLQAGIALVSLDRAPQAEQALREFLELSSDSPSTNAADIDLARDWLRFLYSVELRFEDRRQILRAIHEAGVASVADSKEFFFPTLLICNSDRGRDRLRRFLAETPYDVRLRIADARYHTAAGETAEARRRLEEVRDRDPSNLDCLAALLETAYEEGDDPAFEALVAAAPPVTATEPWLLTQFRGEFALQQQDWAGAAGHFSRLLAADPAHMSATMGLARARSAQGDNAETERLQRQSLVLARIRPRLIAVTEENADACDEIAADCAETGFDEAAEVFRQHAVRIRGGVVRGQMNSTEDDRP